MEEEQFQSLELLTKVNKRDQDQSSNLLETEGTLTLTVQYRTLPYRTVPYRSVLYWYTCTSCYLYIWSEEKKQRNIRE